MDGIILAAGRGTRLTPLTNKKPKPLAYVGSKTILEHNLDYAIDAGINHVVIVVGYKKEQIIETMGDTYKGIDIDYVVQEDSLGLAHATVQAESKVDTDVFCLFLSDIIYSDPPVLDIKDCLEASTPMVVIDEVPFDEASEYGVCDIQNGSVEQVIEKPENPPSNKIIAGTYVLPNEIFSYCKSIGKSDRGEYELTDAINEYLQETGNIEFREITGERVDVAYMKDLFKARLLEETGQTEMPTEAVM